jgi:hypothetical protein
MTDMTASTDSSPLKGASSPRTRKVLVALGLLALAAFATVVTQSTQVQLTTSSNPPGIVSGSTYHDVGSTVSVPAAAVTSNSYRFAYWKLNGVRQTDALGISVNAFNFKILENSQVVAEYQLESADTDADQVPDWYELRQYGDLNQSPGSDTDEDGVTLLQEYEKGSQPRIPDSAADGGLVEGGISRRRGEKLAVTVGAEYALYAESSTPPGVVSRKEYLKKGTQVSTANLGAEYLGHRFTQWTINGVRQETESGIARNQVSFVIAEDTQAVAEYLPKEQDSDADALPDWYEMNQYGTLTMGPDSDSDEDGSSLADEYANGTQPRIADGADDGAVVEGGVSRRRGEKLALAFDAAFVRYTESSVPGGVVSRDQYMSIGTSITTANAPLESNGYKFSQWLINGARQENDAGIAKSIVTFELKAETKAIAYYYVASQDADADQIPDWYEIQQYGDILQGPDSDTDEDGVDFLTEYQGGTQPRVSDSAGDGGIVEGGVSRRRAEKMVLNLQYFPAAQVADAEGGGIFSDPYNGAGGGFSIEGGSSAPALGDIDGDVDFDLLVGGAGGAVRLLRNAGSAFAPSYDQQTGSDLSSLPNWPQGPVYPAFGDWNKDGRADLVVGSDDGMLRFYLNRSAVGVLFEAAGTLTVGTAAVYPSFFKSADKLDLIVLDGPTGLVSLYGQASGNPPFALPALSADVLGTPVEKGSGLAVADVTGDGLLDILASDRDGRMWLFTGKNGGNFELTSKVWASTSNGFKQGLSGAVADVNGDGDMDLIGGGTDGDLVYLENPEKHLRVTPVVATVRSGETLNYSSVDDDQTLTWSMGRAQSGGLVHAITGVYTAGDKSGLDQVVVRNSAGRMGVAWVNVIKGGESDLKWNALLVDGRRSPNDAIWPAADALNVRAKEILLYRGLNHDQIHWLGHANEGPDGSPTKAALASALRDGATLDPDTETFVVYMADHGRKATNGDGIFLLSENESVTGTELDSWLDALQAARPNLSVLLVVESCYGGRVAGKLAEADDYSSRRLVLSSSGRDELSHLAANGLVSYSTMWWSGLAAGKTIGEAHDAAAAAMDSLQTALTSEGGRALWNSKLGLADVSGTGRPVVVAKETSIDLDGSQETRLAVNVQSALSLNKVWGVVVPPGYSTRGNAPVLDLPEFEMEQDPASGEWAAIVGGFTEGGAPYTILVQARDEWGQVSPPVVIQVNQQDIRNRVIIFAHGQDGWDEADVAAELAHYVKEVALLRRVNEDDIRMIMDPVFDADAVLPCSVERLRTSITSWANADGKLGTLTIVAMGQASKLGLLCANGDTITSFAMKPWLDTLQRQSGATVQLIVDSDYSGHFVANTGSSIYRRIVISSTSKDDRNTFARGRWAGLTRSILNSIARGRDLRESYDEATALSDVSGNESPAELDDNGDGKYTKQRDGFKAVNAFMGSAYVTADDPPFIGRASAAMKVESGGEARFWVSDILMPDGEAPESVWYEVRGPDGDEAGNGNLSWNAATQRYEGVFSGLTASGTYTIYVQAGTQGNPSNTTPPAVIFADYIETKDRGTPLTGTLPPMALPLDGQWMDVENEQGRLWAVSLAKGQRISIEASSVATARDVKLELLGNNGLVLASSDEWGNGFGEKIEAWEAPSDGNYSVRASFAPGNGGAFCKVNAYIKYEAMSFSVKPMLAQTIANFSPIANKTFGDAPFAVAAPTATSSLPVTLSVKSGPATISGNTLTLTGVGTVTLTASQAGNASYNAATELTTSFTVSKATPRITTKPVASTITFGQKLSQATLSKGVASVLGTFSLSNPNLAPKLGKSTQTVLFTPSNVNFKIVSFTIEVNVVTEQKPTIRSHPLPQSVADGAKVSLSVQASGGALRYQWTKNGKNITGAKLSTFTIAAASASDAGDYRVIVYNSKGSVTSNAARITILAPEIDVQQPAGKSLVTSTSKISFGTGTTKKTSAGIRRTFTIRNTGTTKLTGISFSKRGTHQNDFTVTQSNLRVVAPGASATFTVTFKPAAVGQRAASLRITSNDRDENPFIINFAGQGAR